MKKIIIIFLCLIFCFFCLTTITYAADIESAQEISVTIIDPAVIEGKPVYNADIKISVKNLTNNEIKGLVCYLMIVDVERQQTYPVDEFGPDAYQTRIIESLRAHSEYTVTIPVKILYVGLFKFSASVMNLDKNYTVTADPLTVHMVAASKLNKTLVITTASIVPLFVAGIAVVLYWKRRKKGSL